MILVTGGAGFIGSNLVAALVARGERVVISDRLRDGAKWKNIAKHAAVDIVMPEALFSWLEAHGSEIDIVFHMGAISATTETDVDKIIHSNLRLSIDLWTWCARNGVRFVYASSAATYGAGELGFLDDNALDHLTRLRPLNPYGWSKALFDINAIRMVEDGIAPPQWAGMKFFNVYGPNENHKGPMRSVVVQLYEHLREHGSVRLFRSRHPHYPDGGQMRDFVWVGDCVRMMLWLEANPGTSGIFNCGTGQARAFIDLAHAVFAASGIEGAIDWVDTPEHIARHYQYFTEADMSRVRQAGYDAPPTGIEDGVRLYLRDHLMTEDIYA